MRSFALFFALMVACETPTEPVECEETFSASCPELLQRKQDMIATYDELAANGNATAALDSAVCGPQLFDALSAAECQTDCQLLCAFQSCAGDDRCEQRCESFSENIDLHSVGQRSAKRPGECSCGICDEASVSFCEEMWDCGFAE